MIRFLFILLLVGCAASAPKTYLTLTTEPVQLVLLQAPCTDPKIRGMINERYRDQFQAGEGLFQLNNGTRQKFNGCWLELNKIVHIVFDDGDAYSISIEDFDQNKTAKPKGAQDS